MNAETEMQEDSEAPPTALNVKIVGIGGAGCRVVEELMQDNFEGADFAVVNTERVSLAKSFAGEKLLLETNLLRGMGTGGDANLGRVAAEGQFDRLKELCDGSDVIFIVGGLGGGAASGAGPVLARAARETGALVLGVVTLPFDCEGRMRLTQARFGLEKLKAAADGVISLSNQKVFGMIDENTSVLDTFSYTNRLLREGLKGIWDLLTSRSLIDVHFTDLCSVVRGRHAVSSFATVEAVGENRSREVIDKLFAHPMLDDGALFENAGSVLVSLRGGPDLTMGEINRVMEQINRRCGEAQVLLGAGVDEALSERLSATVVITRHDPRDREEQEQARREQAAGDDLDTEFLSQENTKRPAARLVPPPPEMDESQQDALLQRKGEGRRRNNRLRQSTLPLEIVSKGRFDKTEPTIHNGEDLDVPTYIRRGVALN